MLLTQAKAYRWMNSRRNLANPLSQSWGNDKRNAWWRAKNSSNPLVHDWLATGTRYSSLRGITKKWSTSTFLKPCMSADFGKQKREDAGQLMDRTVAREQIYALNFAWNQEAKKHTLSELSQTWSRSRCQHLLQLQRYLMRWSPTRTSKRNKNYGSIVSLHIYKSTKYVVLNGSNDESILW